MESQAANERHYYRFEEQPGDKPLEVTKQSDLDPVPTLVAYNGRDAVYNELRFWRRQFGEEITPKQRKSNWIFGVALPLICFFFDPIVFRGWHANGDGFLSYFKIFAYSLAITSIMAMAAWLLWGEKLRWLNGWFAGLFFVAGVISLLVGVVLFPISTLGLMFIIGCLGYAPLFSSVIYLRNAVRASRAAVPFFDARVLKWTTALGAIAALAIPWAINQTFN